MAEPACACGCGQATTIAKRNRRGVETKKGERYRYVHGHAARKDPQYVIDDNGCWLWQQAINESGYGMYSVPGGKRVRAHRYMYEQLVGPIPDGLVIDHLCRVRHCVNPAHMEPVTSAENVRRGGEAQTHCKRGHEFTEANTYLSTRSDGGVGRNCRACHALQARLAYQRKRGLIGRCS